MPATFLQPVAHWHFRPLRHYASCVSDQRQCEMMESTGVVPEESLRLQQAPEDLVRVTLPHLSAAELADLARVIGTLLRAFQPERIYAFGSQARSAPSRHSDIDLLVVVSDTGEYPHRLAQEAYRVVDHYLHPLDIVFMSREEFEWRSKVVTSLPATVLREGKLLYAAGIA